MEGLQLGIDYGTSNTVAVLRWPDGRSRTLLFDNSPLLPSAVFAADDGRLLVGRDAERAARAAPGRFEPNPKRRIDEPDVLLGDRVYPITELVAAALERVAAEAQRTAGGPVDRVTLTHPVAWGPARRKVLVDAAQRVGLPTPVLVAEPVAAAAYFTAVLGNGLAVGQSVVVYDLGAGTFDVSVVQRTGDGFATLAYSGIDDIGGLDLDALVVAHVSAALADSAPQAWRDLDDPTDQDGRRHRLQLWQDARAARETLTRESSATIYVAATQRDVITTREEFERAATGVLHRTVAATLETVRAARVRPDSVAGWFLVGGATRTPLVATMLLRASGQPATALEEPQLVVADGAVHLTPAGSDDGTVPASAAQRIEPPAHPADRIPRPGPLRPRRRLAAGLTAVAVVLVLAALAVLIRIGDDGRAGSDAASGAARTIGGASGFNAATRGVVRPSDKRGGTLELISHDPPDSFDPARTYLTWVWNFSKGYYVRSLLTHAAKPGRDGLELVPDLATALPKIEDGGKQYTFTLKDGVKFEDGSPITSKDIKYGIERIFAQDVLPGGPTYLIDVLDQGQQYPGPYKDTDPNKLGLRSVATPDDKTIVFTLAEPLPDFIHLLAMAAAGPVPLVRDTGRLYTAKPFSSGPYKFESYEEGRQARLVRNDQWDPRTDIVRKALPEQIDLTIGAAPEKIRDQLVAGIADLDVTQNGVQPGAASTFLDNPDNRKNADTPTTGFLRYAAVNTKMPPFDNVHCRRAVQYATDKTAMQTAHGGPDAGDVGTSMLPPTIVGHDPGLDPYGTGSGRPQLDKARAELSACGRPDGFNTVIATLNTGTEPQTAEALRAALKNVGINADVDPTGPAGYFSSTIGAPSNVHAKGYGLMMTGWGADFPTGYGFLSMLVDGRNIPPAGNNNHAELDNAEVNSLIDQAKAETDANKAADIWGRINKIVMDEAVMVPFVYDKALNYRNPRLTNVYVTDYYGMYDFGSLGIG